MCRFLALHATAPLDPAPWIQAFAPVCRASPEDQGHGWGVAVQEEGKGWTRHRSADPIWEAPVPALPASSLLFLHARSAFRNEGISEANAMPFLDSTLAFAFNGELRGVRLAVPGETGAHRLMSLLGRFRTAARGDVGAALERLYALMNARSRSIRGMNVVASDGRGYWIGTQLSEDPDYFTLHQCEVERVDPEPRTAVGPGASKGAVQAVVVASEPVPLPPGFRPRGGAWQPLPAPQATPHVTWFHAGVPCAR